MIKNCKYKEITGRKQKSFIEVLFQFLIQALNKFTYDTLKQGDKIINCLILWNNMNGCFYLYNPRMNS
jgi:hypothetical protein